jgi:dihydroorotate dehydrogenase electron transfer subunit
LKQINARVVSISKPIKGLERPGGRSIMSSRIITFDCPEISGKAEPGQFVMVNCGEGKNILPRAFSINRVTDKSMLSLFFAVLENGAGTEWLSNRQAGDNVKILGPIGSGFKIWDTSHNILLVSGGMGIAPLVFLAEEALKRKISVTLFYGTPGKNRYPVEDILSGANIVIATEDGTEGHHGLVTELLPEYIDKADQVFICGPASMYRYLKINRVKLLKDKPVQISLEARMACGRGICYGCTIQTINGSKRVCEHGPVFDLDDIFQDDTV